MLPLSEREGFVENSTQRAKYLKVACSQDYSTPPPENASKHSGFEDIYLKSSDDTEEKLEPIKAQVLCILNFSLLSDSNNISFACYNYM